MTEEGRMGVAQHVLPTRVRAGETLGPMNLSPFLPKLSSTHTHQPPFESPPPLPFDNNLTSLQSTNLLFGRRRVALASMLLPFCSAVRCRQRRHTAKEKNRTRKTALPTKRRIVGKRVEPHPEKRSLDPRILSRSAQGLWT